MKYFIIFVLFTIVVAQPPPPLNPEEEWMKFKRDNQKVYVNAQEEVKRKGIFLDNFSKIIVHNKKFEKGEVSFEIGVNKYSDLTHEEFLEKWHGPRKPTTQPPVLSNGQPNQVPQVPQGPPQPVPGYPPAPPVTGAPEPTPSTTHKKKKSGSATIELCSLTGILSAFVVFGSVYRNF